MEVGKMGTIFFPDYTTARVKLVEIEKSKSGMFPADYWITYVEGETNKQLIHPDFGKLDIIKTEIVLPEDLVKQLITFD